MAERNLTPEQWAVIDAVNEYKYSIDLGDGVVIEMHDARSGIDLRVWG